MPGVEHPLLIQDREPVVPVVEEPKAVEPEAPATPPEPTPEPEPAAVEPTVEDFYRLPKGQAGYKALQDLADADPEVRNYLNSLVGRKAKKEYTPKIDQLELELATARTELLTIQRQSMDEEQVKERMLRDPDFAKSFHQELPDLESLKTQRQWASAVDTVFDAVDGVIPPQRQAELRQFMANGWFDYEHDAAGNPIGEVLSPQAGLVKLQQSLTQEAQAFQRALTPPPTQAVAVAPAKPPEPEPKAEPNLALAQASPDLTAPTAGGARNVWKESEVKAMDRATKMATFPGWGDYDVAWKEGRILQGQ